MSARKNPRAGTRARRPVPEFFHSRMLLVHPVKVSAECRPEVGVVPGRIGHEVIAPVIEDASMRVGKAVCDVALELAASRLKAVNRGVSITHWRAPGRFDLCAMKNAIAQINRAAGVEAKRVRGVMRIR